MGSSNDAFRKRVSLGRRFEKWERSRWTDPEHQAIEFETLSTWRGKRGRLDLRLMDKEEGHTILVEMKASDWDTMAPHRIRPNALRHARQIWRYIEAELAEQPVLPALVCPSEPKTPGRKEEVEGILHERLIQVAWRKLSIDAL